MWIKLKLCLFSFISMNLAWIRRGFVLSKTVIFMWGLAFSYAFAKKGVVDVLVDFLGDENYDLRKSTILVNFLDVMSSVLTLAVIHVSEAYTGRFKAIIFCTAAHIMGLVVLFIRSVSDIDALTLASILLIALGMAGKKPTLREFFDYQLSEEVKKKGTDQKIEGEDGKESSEEEKERTYENDSSETGNLWWPTASMIGSVAATLCLGLVGWAGKFQITAATMGSTCLLFIIGIYWYYPEEKPSQSPLTTIYRVYKVAIKKHKLPYPSSEQGYNNEGSDDISVKPLFDVTENGEFRLLPLYLSFLDRAAMTNYEGEVEVGNQEVFTVVQVRDVKTLHLIIPLGITFLAYSLVSASGNTYFVLQTSNLSSFSVFGFDVPIMVLFAISSLVASVVRAIQSRYELVKPHWSMAVGLFCSVICCIAAWQVERHRLSLILENPEKDFISLSVMILAPQYLLLGLMEGFAEGGLETFLSDRLYSESMKKFAGPCIELLLGIGKFWNILFALVFHEWIKDKINDSHLDRYFLMLALLSFLVPVICVLCVNFKFQNPQSVYPETTTQETTVEMVGESLQVQVDIKH